MSFERKRRFWHSLAFRLSLTYASCCFVSMVAILFVCYVSLEGTLRKGLDAGLAEEVVEYGALLKSQNLEILDDVLNREAYSEGTDQVFFRILDRNGDVVITTDTSSWGEIVKVNAHLQSALSGKYVFEDFHDPKSDFHARLLIGKVADGLVLQLGESKAASREVLRHFQEVFVIATVAFILCSLFAGAYMAKRSLSGVQVVTDAAAFIAAGAWEHRVPVSQRNDELDELASAFNAMVDRIQVLFRELREVTDDIAHDLRTPLMRIRLEAEMALREGAGSDGMQERCGSVLEECDQMLGLINMMLEISQTEAGATSMERKPSDISAAVEDVVELFRSVAEDKSITLDFEGGPCLMVEVDEPRLKRAVVHLVDNAIKYTPGQGRVTVRCEDGGDVLRIVVRDTGIGIPPGLMEDVFSRFYRVDSSRTLPGNGLGLSLARAIVRAHGGDIRVDCTSGGGSTFVILLPMIRNPSG